MEMADLTTKSSQISFSAKLHHKETMDLNQLDHLLVSEDSKSKYLSGISSNLLVQSPTLKHSETESSREVPEELLDYRECLR